MDTTHSLDSILSIVAPYADGGGHFGIIERALRSCGPNEVVAVLCREMDASESEITELLTTGKVAAWDEC